jgi:oxidoreductase
MTHRDVYCCLGTTRRDAGGAEQFKKIDQSYVINSAKIIAEENKPEGAKLAPVHFLYCSSGVKTKQTYPYEILIL